MNRPALPFTLAPLPGESFDSWLEAYAARLRSSTGDLATGLGLPIHHLRTQIGVLLRRGLPARHLAPAAAAAGLPAPVLAAMFHRPGPAPAARPSAARALRNAWAPAAGTRFCPACLAGNQGRYLLAWRLPWTFYCLTHDQLLASTCPHCGQPPRARMIAVAHRPARGRCGTPLPQRTGPTRPACDADLSAAGCPPITGPPGSRDAQLFINTHLARASDPAATGPARAAAAAILTDLSVIAFHLAAPRPVNGQHKIRAHMLHAAALTSAVELLTTTGPGPAADPLRALVHQHASPRASAVPESWRTASPALNARIIRHRDPDLAATERLRRATTLPAPLPPRPRQADPATTRISRIPGQIWPDWALRLTDDHNRDHAIFRQAAAAALLLPASNLPLAKLAALTSPHITGDTLKHQLAILASAPGGTTALQIITELGLALDTGHVPIDYTRRRALAAAADLIDAVTWRQLARTCHHYAGSHRRLTFARTYLYELLTGGPPTSAPPPGTLPAGPAGTRAAYHDFVLHLPAPLASALTEHARHLLTHAGITGEPLQWQPPASWVTITTWPGTDPSHTDPAPLHHALRHGNQPAGQIAQTHGLSLEHLRQVIRRHPLPATTTPRSRPGTILPRTPSTPTAANPGACHVDLPWLREQYLTWQRTFADIASQIGCNPTTLAEFAKQHGLPARPRGGGRHYIDPATAPAHPADIPQPLRSALTGRDARQRIDRFLLIAEHPSIRSAAHQLGITPSAIGNQLTHLEHRCGGHLFTRQHHRLAHLTPLGNQLRDQARHYLTNPALKETDNYPSHQPPPP